VCWGTELKAQKNSSDTLVINNRKVKPVVYKPHSPHKASFYSAILPGLGQVYNKKYWKVPIVAASFGGIIYGIKFNSDLYNDYRQYYRDYLIQDPSNQSYYTHKIFTTGRISKESVLPGGTNAEWFERSLKNGKNYYKRYRDLSYVGFAAIYVLNIIDATVDAHFKTFDVSDDLSFNLEPVVKPGLYGSNSIGLQMTIVF